MLATPNHDINKLFTGCLRSLLIVAIGVRNENNHIGTGGKKWAIRAISSRCRPSYGSLQAKFESYSPWKNGLKTSILDADRRRLIVHSEKSQAKRREGKHRSKPDYSD